MDYILEIDNAVSKEFCEDAISRFENDKRQVIGATIGGVDEKVKKSIDLPISGSGIRGDWQDVVDETGKCVSDGLMKYQEYTEAEGLDRCLAVYKTVNSATIGLPQIQKTEKDGFYTWHHDGFLNRILTYILYLNDVEEGVGGTTEFLNRGHIQPKAGKLVIFPANLAYVHRGITLKKGVKYLITNFIYEGPPILEHPAKEQTPKSENDEI